MSNDVIDFYNKESAVYSLKRYVGEVTSYTQFFFHRRLALLLVLVKPVVEGRSNLTLLDIACADGIITQTLAREYRQNFAALVGIDIAPAMIEVARRQNTDPRISFYLKSETPADRYDIVLGLGFLSGSILFEEVEFVKQHLRDDGFYICTLVSKYSIISLLKVRKKPYYKEYWSYHAQEDFLKKDFEILEVIPCGFFVPWLWKFPKYAKRIQSIHERVFSIFPNLYQEKIYMLKKKT